MSDKNFFRITGDEAGNIWLNDRLTFRAEEPGIRMLALDDVIVPQAEGYADALKFSGVRRLRVCVNRIDATFCAEDAIDINHCAELQVVVQCLWPARKYCGTIKGASRAISIEVVDQRGHGGETDWDLGNFSDQGNARTTGVQLDVLTFDSSPVRVRLLSADMPLMAIRPGGQCYQVDTCAQGWFYPVFNFFKDLLRTFGWKI